MGTNEYGRYIPSTPARIILDTDIGPDCDDAGAVAVLHALEKRGEVRIAGMMHCTSGKWGAGCLDALNRFYGRGDIPVGTLRDKGFLDDDNLYAKYNKVIAETFPNRYRNEPAPDAVRLYRKLLAEGENFGAVVVAIGPLLNLQQLLQSAPDEISPLSGAELVARKVKHLVVMGGRFPEGEEWNFAMHPASARFVTDRWPTGITFTGFEIGLDILTGKRLYDDLPSGHPVRQCYARFAGEGQTRSSWDLTAVLFAARGGSSFWETVHGRIDVDGETGRSEWHADSAGPHAYLRAVTGPEEAAKTLDALMVE
ncbi:nucleoside hydrolase [Cohnella zeiphila]|uniref:Nucleoside hydrolase n=1 Tax=Cohnella zeiphila TaxID=2761120 RepID=A0A7X0SIL4_9BACL|nr:nucleoside hydrolase [Cohnella zeiphila]MBB6730632.1 nucleoside hydrolase [Cohnella zeiphila]